MNMEKVYDSNFGTSYFYTCSDTWESVKLLGELPNAFLGFETNDYSLVEDPEVGGARDHVENEPFNMGVYNEMKAANVAGFAVAQEKTLDDLAEQLGYSKGESFGTDETEARAKLTFTRVLDLVMYKKLDLLQCLELSAQNIDQNVCLTELDKMMAAEIEQVINK